MKAQKKRKKLGIKTLLRMLVEWHECSEEPQVWWDRYPSFSCNDVVKLARQKLNERRK